MTLQLSGRPRPYIMGNALDSSMRPSDFPAWCRDRCMGGGPMVRLFAAVLAVGLIGISASGATARAGDLGANVPADVPEVLASAFGPPPQFRDDFGAYKSPLIFDDGRPVRDAADWRARREEILAAWHGIMGAW